MTLALLEKLLFSASLTTTEHDSSGTGLTVVLGQVSSANQSQDLVFSTPLGVGVPFPAAFVVSFSPFGPFLRLFTCSLSVRGHKRVGLLEHMTSRQDEKQCCAGPAAAEVHRMRQRVFILRRNGNYARKK